MVCAKMRKYFQRQWSCWDLEMEPGRIVRGDNLEALESSKQKALESLAIEDLVQKPSDAFR